MQICVCGWYFLPETYRILQHVNHRYPVTVVCHRRIPDMLSTLGKLTHVFRANTGLEFGAYDYFIKSMYWDNRQPVLFMHDDVNILDGSLFDDIADCKADQRFVFRDKENGEANQNFHGRMFFCSPAFIRSILTARCDCHQSMDRVDYHNNHFCSRVCADNNAIVNGWANDFKIYRWEYKEGQSPKRCVECGTIIDAGEFWAPQLKGTGIHCGIWYDPNNNGHNSGRPPIGVRHYNDAIYHLALQVSRLHEKLDSGGCFYSPKINLYKRGEAV